MKRHINFYIILSLILCITLCGCKNDDSNVTQTQSSSETIITSGTEETSVATTMIISKLSNTSYYFACVDFVEEFTNLNEGGFEYFEDTNEIKIGVTKSTGTYTGCLDGPMLEFTVNLTTEEVTDKEYTPQPDDENFQVYRPDNDELDKMSNERLVEVAKMFYEKMSSDEVDMSNYEENKNKFKAQTTTSETETTTSQPLETGEKEVEDEQKITMTAKYNADTQMVEYTINNLSDYDFVTGYSFDFEYLEDGKYVPVKKHEVCIPAIAEIYSPDEKINRAEYLPYWFNVKNGKYRLIKRGNFNKEKLNLYADFEVTGIENNNYINLNNIENINFRGRFNENTSFFIEDTTDFDIIKNFVNKLNTIEAMQCNRISGMGNWCEGLWDVIVHKDNEHTYSIHQQDNKIMITDTLIRENNCLVIELSDEILKEFENTVFDFDNTKWNDGVNYFGRFISDVSTFDSYAGNNFNKHIIFVASDDLSEYKKIEQKYADEHNLDTVIYKIVDYSLNDLRGECEIIEEKGKEFTVKSACPDIEDNGLKVYLEDNSDENQNAVRNLTDVKNIKFDKYTGTDADINPKT